MQTIKQKTSELTDIQRIIFGKFYDLQFDDEYFNDESYLMQYSRLEKETHIGISVLKTQVIKLRNMGLIELVTAFDYDFNRSGSGYTLTYRKGQDLARELFCIKE